MINIQIADKPAKALLDSGASVSLLCRKVFDYLSPEQIETSNSNPLIRITTIAGEQLKLHLSALLPIQIARKSFKHNFLVTRGNTISQDYDVILGFDFLTAFKCKINFQNQVMTFRGGTTPIVKYESNKINILYEDLIGKLSKKIIIQPNKSAIVKLSINNTISPGTNVLVTPITSQNFEINPSLCHVNKDGTVPLIVNNLTHSPLHLNKYTKVAHIDTRINVEKSDDIREIRRTDLKASHFDLSNVPLDAKQQLLDLIFEYADIFSTSLRTIGRCTLEAPPIEITDSTPIQCRPFPVPIALRNTLKTQIQELADADIIEKSKSRYSFPLILVRKKTEGEYRLVVDYRRLNQITIASTYKLPLISDILNSLRGACFYSTLDANSSFHQIKLREEDKHLTAFASPYGNYQYKYLSFGMKNSPQIFQETADTILNGLQSENISAYIDDIIVPANSIKDSLRKLRLVFDRFRKYGLTLNPKKCQFLQTSINYLGHTVDKEGLKPLPCNLMTIKHFPVPTTVRKLKRFLGLANYYRTFIDNFSHIVLPLTELTKSKTKFKWTSDTQNAFDLIKSKLLSDVMLSHPNFDKQFYLNTDGSTTAVGAALLQRDHNDILRPISYFSYKLKPHEKKWPAIQLEAYAILLAVRHFKVYLYGRKFTILSDCKSLNYLLKLDSPASRISRWLLELSHYDFDFQYIKGSENFLGDLLSRDVVESVNVVKADVPDIETIRREQRNDTELRSIIDYLEHKTHTAGIKSDNYFMDNGLLKRITHRHKRAARDDYLEQIVIPKSLIPYILEGSETVHFAFFKNYRSIKEKYYWRNMYRDIKNFSYSCKLCIEKKGFSLTKSPIQNFQPTSRPMELISLDILGPLPMSEQGNKYVLTVIDHFSKYSILFALKDITAPTIANKLMEVVVTFGVPNSILTDLGTNFQSTLFTELAKKLQIHKLKTTPYRPQTNSVSERINASIKTSLTCLADNTSNWDTYLSYYNFIYNNSYHDTIHEKPSFLMFNRDLNLPFHVLEQQARIHYFPCDNYIEENLSKMQYIYRNVYKNLEIANEKQFRLRERISKQKAFQLGQKVYLYTPTTNQNTGRAFARKFSGPYRIIQKHSNLNYTIQDTRKPFKKPSRVHVDRLFSYTERRPELLIPDTVTKHLVPSFDTSQFQSIPNDKRTYHNTYPDSDNEEDDFFPLPVHSQPIRQSQQSSDPELQFSASPQTSGQQTTNETVTQQSLSDNQSVPGSASNTQELSNTTPDKTALAIPKTGKSQIETEHRYNLRPRPGRPTSHSVSQSGTLHTQSTSLPDRFLNWAMDSRQPQSEKNMLDKIGDVLAGRLAANLPSGNEEVNNLFFKPQRTRIFFNSNYVNHS